MFISSALSRKVMLASCLHQQRYNMSAKNCTHASVRTLISCVPMWIWEFAIRIPLNLLIFEHRLLLGLNRDPNIQNQAFSHNEDQMRTKLLRFGHLGG